MIDTSSSETNRTVSHRIALQEYFAAQHVLIPFRFSAEQMRELQELLHDPAITEFAIVTIPTALALTESERLLLALRDEGIAVRSAIVNRLINEDAADSYLEQLAKGQQGCLGELNELAARCDVDVTPVPYFDVEVCSAYGLRAMGAALFDAPKG